MLNKDQRMTCTCGAVYEFSISAKQICAPNTTELAATDIQQLKAIIAALVPVLCTKFMIGDSSGFYDVCEKLRLLSAV